MVCSSCGKLVGVQDEKCWSCGRRNPGLWGFGPALRSLGRDLGFGPMVLGFCVLLYVVSLAIDPSAIRSGGILSMLSPSGNALYLLGASGSYPIFFDGRWWTPLSAGWLHGGLLHIFFNLYWFRMLAPTVAEMFGPGRSVLLYVGSSVSGFVATSVVARYFGFLPEILQGAPVTVGASAAIFGWLGALLYCGRRMGSSHLTQQVWGFVVPLMVLGFLLRAPSGSGQALIMVDNWAHIGGFGGGWLLARWFDPLRPERVDHVFAALIAIALSVLSVLVSVAEAFLR